jgi:5'-nucleotidase / UDP-sugar diphosphatase
MVVALRFLLVVASLFACVASRLSAQAPDSRPLLLILHTNDVHGQIRPVPDPRSKEGAPKMAGGYQELVFAIDEERARTPHSLLVDGGDWWQGTPEGTLSNGRCSVELMNAAGYDFAVLGNHDFDAGPEALTDLLRLARFRVLGANVAARADANPFANEIVAHAKSTPVVVNVGAFRLAVAGLTTEETPRITAPRALDGIVVESEVMGAAYVRRRLRLPRDRDARDGATSRSVDEIDADGLLFVNHMGRDRNVELSKVVPDVDVIVGGHDHSGALPEGYVTENGVLIAQAASHTKALGVVEIEIDPKTRRIARKSARLRPIEPNPDLVVPRVAPIIRRHEEAVAAAMDVPIADVAEHMGRASDPFAQGPLGPWIAETMIEATGADVAVHNQGGVRADLPAGRARLREFFQISPFGNRLVVVDMKARDLSELARRAAANPGRGFIFAGLEILASRDAAGRAEVKRLRRGGRDLRDDDVLSVVTTDFLAGARDGASAFARAENYRDVDLTLLDATVARARALQTVVAPRTRAWVLEP